MGNAITIVAGLPRSGTSLMMQMLAAGGMPVLTDNIRIADEDNPRGYYEFEAVKQVKEDLTWLEGAQGKVFKMVYRLLYDLPTGYQYQVVMMRRRLEEVVASQNEMLRRSDKQHGNIDDARLVEIYGSELEKVGRWLREQSNFRVLDVHYQDVLEEPERIVADLNTFLGGELDLQAMIRVPDPTLYRQRR